MTAQRTGFSLCRHAGSLPALKPPNPEAHAIPTYWDKHSTLHYFHVSLLIADVSRCQSGELNLSAVPQCYVFNPGVISESRARQNPLSLSHRRISPIH